ncbi:hypothetical protein ACOME3_008831 [Neoechinorhynchus agilis]
MRILLSTLHDDRKSHFPKIQGDRKEGANKSVRQAGILRRDWLNTRGPRCREGQQRRMLRLTRTTNVPLVCGTDDETEEIVQENNSVDHDSFDEDFENAEPIPNTTDDDQEDIADENSLEDLHSDSSNDWSGMDNCDNQTHRTIHQVISITLLSLKLQPPSITVQKTLATIPMEL